MPQGQLRTQCSHPIMPSHLQAVSLRARTCSCCQRLGMSFPILTTIIYQKGRVSWHKKHPWPRSEMKPKARAITGWTRHSNRCLLATRGPFAGWLWELIQPRSWRGTSNLSHTLCQTHWEGEQTELVQQEEKEVGMAQWKGQRIWVLNHGPNHIPIIYPLWACDFSW